MRRRSELAASAVTILLLSGCAVEQPGTDGGSMVPGSSSARSSLEPPVGDVATWSLARDELLDPTTTFLVVEVTRLGCSSGITGTVLDPHSAYESARVLVRADVENLGPDEQDCQGNDAVPVEIHLDQPLGVRELVDAACLEGDAMGSAACTDAVRWAPPTELTRHDGVPDWQPPPAYSFVVQSSCGEQAFIGEYAVTVGQDNVVAVDALRQGWDEIGVGAVPSMAAMLDLARQAESSGEADVWVDQEGIPRWFELDPVLNGIDDENCFLITHYDET